MDLGRYGIREVANVTFRPLQPTDIGDQHFDKMQPCLFMDTATVNSFEGSATTVYARGGQGNPKRIAWDGEKEITVTFTDALLSTVSLAMLSGADVNTGKIGSKEAKEYVVHQQYDGFITANGEGYELVVPANKVGGQVWAYGAEDLKAPRAYAYLLDEVGGVEHVFTGYIGCEQTEEGNAHFDLSTACRNAEVCGISAASLENEPVRVDYYVKKTVGVTELNISADVFAGTYYIEADALFRDEETSMDFPATFIIPRGKIQSNWNISLSNSGDPSTFDFVIDAMPGYVRGQRSEGEEAKQVLMTIQIQEPGVAADHPWTDDHIHGHNDYKGSGADEAVSKVDYIDIWDTNRDELEEKNDLGFEHIEDGLGNPLDPDQGK